MSVKNNLIKNETECFYLRDDLSRYTAGKKECRTSDKKKEQIRYLNDTIGNLYQIYKSEGAKTELKRTSGVLQKFLTLASTSRPVFENDNVTAAELALSFHTVKQTKMQALVMEALGPHALESVVSDLKDENMYFCLQTDASNKKKTSNYSL
ncbi:unnamed protein product [Euphydryas editha]|uniref:Uncharacterized protein n=1 Tax=Euphydryas editha TaxID=104508 RepID=A0AAU9TTU8_EUPED|nr:unnamed protein product [Euphydryas editha]